MRPFNFTYLTQAACGEASQFNTDLKRSHLELLKTLIREHNVTVFISLRQNTFKRALSRYHNGVQDDGKSHLQFQVASGLLKPDAIDRIVINPQIFDLYVKRCIADIQSKKEMIAELRHFGIEVYPLIYEDFLNDPTAFFLDFFRTMKEEVTEQEIIAALSEGTPLKKIHSKDISHYVVNHLEIMRRFGRYDFSNDALVGSLFKTL
jgi:hypothetical protein